MNSSLEHRRLDETQHPTVNITLPGTNITHTVLEHQSIISTNHLTADSYSPQSNTSALLGTQSAILDIYVNSGRVSRVRAMFLEMLIVNNGVNNAFLINPMYWCGSSPIIFYANGNSIAEHYAEGNFQQFATMNNEESEMWCNLIGFLYPSTLATTNSLVPIAAPTTANSFYIPAGQSAYVYIPILNNFFQQSGAPLSSIADKTQLKVRFQFDNIGFIACNGNVSTPNISVSSAQLFVVGSGAGSLRNTNFVSPVITEKISGTYFKQERQILNIGSATPNQQINNTLTSLNGLYDQISIFLRRSGATKEELVQYFYDATFPYVPSSLLITQATLYDGNGSPVFINNLRSNVSLYAFSLAQQQLNDGLRVSTFVSKYPIIFYTLGVNPHDELRQGRVGCVYVNSSWSSQINAPLAFPGGAASFNYELVVCGSRLYEFTIEQSGLLLSAPAVSY